MRCADMLKERAVHQHHCQLYEMRSIMYCNIKLMVYIFNVIVHRFVLPDLSLISLSAILEHTPKP